MNSDVSVLTLQLSISFTHYRTGVIRLMTLDDIIGSRTQETQKIDNYFRQPYNAYQQTYTLASLAEILDFIQRDQVEGMENFLLATYQTHITIFFRTLDESGISDLLGTEKVHGFFRDFSFAENESFQNHEIAELERAVRVAAQNIGRFVARPRVTEETWNVFWQRADQGKEVILIRIQDSLRERVPFLFQFMLTPIAQLDSSSFDLMDFSPFKWKRFGLAVLGGLLGVANLTAGLPTFGAGIASVASAAGAVITALSGQVDR